MAKAVIIGGGIGGLFAGVALRAIGWEVTIHEQAPALTEVGAAVNLSPNGTRLLRAYGLLETVRVGAWDIPGVELRMGGTGLRIFEMPMGKVAKARWGAPNLSVHRADLVAVLAEAFDGTLILGSKVTPDTAFDADLVIAADGSKSALRNALFLGAGRRFAGMMALRATLTKDQVADLPLPRNTCIWVGPGRHIVTGWMRGGTLLNVVGVVDCAQAVADDWESVAAREDISALWTGWLPALQALFDRAGDGAGLGAVYPPAAAQLALWDDLPAGGCRPCHGAVHGPGGCAGDGGRRGSGPVPADVSNHPHGPAPLRHPPHRAGQ